MLSKKSATDYDTEWKDAPAGGGGGGGGELAYVERASSVMVPGGSAQQDVVSSGALTYDGSPVVVEFSAPKAIQTVLSAQDVLFVGLWDDLTWLGILGALEPYNVYYGVPLLLRRRLVPSAGTHTYRIRAHVEGSSGVNIVAGGGGSSTYLPMYVRITKA